MDINSAIFTKSSTTLDQLPSADFPEQAFVGRSNVGKSSLINALLQRKNLAHISSTPGKTQLINHYLVNESWYLVDLPGYGYARTSKKNRAGFAEMIDSYLTQRKSLMNTYVLVDCRIPPQKLDLDFMFRMGEQGLPFTIVFTKVDKLSPNKLTAQVDLFTKSLLEDWETPPPMLLTSAVSKQGRDELLAHIHEANQYFSK